MYIMTAQSSLVQGILFTSTAAELFLLSLVLLCCWKGYLAPYKYDRDMNDREAHIIQAASSPDPPRTNGRENWLHCKSEMQMRFILKLHLQNY